MRAKLPYLDDVIMAFWKIALVLIYRADDKSDGWCAIPTGRGRHARKEITDFNKIDF